jgi:limonene 1,2-monooxygenase
MDRQLRFGAFLAPYHEPRENPTLALERDLDLIAHLDRLGFDEAWVGEHHSTGWETIASPELFLAVAAERTRHIRLGTGAVSLPYHHPLMVADRLVLLDHLTRGRINFGVGPGGHLTDAAMLGIPPALLRERQAEALAVILRLFTQTEPFTYLCDWFELHDAVLQIRPYQRPHPPIATTSMESPGGMQLAGRFGAGVLSLAVSRGPRGPIDLAAHWRIAEEAAQEAGRSVDRAEWRLVVPIHLAETRREAVEDVRAGAGRFLLDYVEGTTGRPRPVPGPYEKVVDQMMELGAWIIGTPDEAIEAIEALWERSGGGFGGVLVFGQEWGGPAATHRSYELLARHVAPRFQGSLAGLERSNAIARSQTDTLHRERTAGVERAQADYEGDAHGRVSSRRDGG